MINTFMFKQQTARKNRSLTYIKSSEKQYNNLNERTRKSFSTPPLFTSKFTVEKRTIKPIIGGAHVHSDTKGQPKLN